MTVMTSFFERTGANLHQVCFGGIRKLVAGVISEIEITAGQLNQYKADLAEEAEASVRLEPGVIAIFPMYEEESDTTFRILEIYSDRRAYESI